MFHILPGHLFTGFTTLFREPKPGQEASLLSGASNWHIGSYRCCMSVIIILTVSTPDPISSWLYGTYKDLAWYHEPIVSRDLVVLTPKCPKGEEDGWGTSFDPGTSPMMAKTFKMLEMTERAFNLDQDRYYIYGNSMGGYGTYAFIQKKPEMFAAGYVLCGNGNIDIAPILSKVPLWIFHGSHDSIVPVMPSRELYHAVLKSGGRLIRYTEYEGAGHNLWDYVRNESTLSSWLLAQRKGSVHKAPEPVKGFTGALFEKGISLQWEVPAQTAPPSDQDIWYCRIYRNGRLLKEVNRDRQQLADSWVLPNSTYSYQISAVNYFFKESELSSPVSITVAQ
jgi:hypothetical protein